MKVFVTGASGFIGQCLLRHLSKAGHAVTVLLRPGRAECLVGSAHTVRGDITQPETLTGALRNMDAIIHLAGCVGDQKWGSCITVNRDGTRTIAEEAIRSGVRRFIHLSSVSVYGRVPLAEIREDSPVRKIGDPYGDTKIDAEGILLEYSRQGKLDLTMIRPTVVYGPGDTRFLPTLVASVRSKPIRMVGDGEQTVDLVHVEDLARFVMLVLGQPRSVGRIYNLTNPANPSWNELLECVKGELEITTPIRRLPYAVAYRLAGVMELFSRITGKEPRLTRYAVRVVGRQYHYVTEAAQNEMGFTPTIELLEGIKRCLRETPGSRP